jgi:hypothetical protein
MVTEFAAALVGKHRNCFKVVEIIISLKKLAEKLVAENCAEKKRGG